VDKNQPRGRGEEHQRDPKWDFMAFGEKCKTDDDGPREGSQDCTNCVYENGERTKPHPMLDMVWKGLEAWRDT